MESFVWLCLGMPAIGTCMENQDLSHVITRFPLVHPIWEFQAVGSAEPSCVAIDVGETGHTSDQDIFSLSPLSLYI